MPATKIDPSTRFFLIDQLLNISSHEHTPGPPQRLDGMTVGIIDMTENAPHNGELHPDGDELVYVISGAIRVTFESTPGEHTDLHAGDATIVPKGEWHQISLLEPSRLLHITPGPNGDHRPLT